MAIGRAERRKARAPRIADVFGREQASAVLDLLELTELAWHDCYGEVTPPETVIEDILTVSQGTLEGLVQAAKLAVTDSRDLQLAAEKLRKR